MTEIEVDTEPSLVDEAKAKGNESDSDNDSEEEEAKDVKTKARKALFAAVEEACKVDDDDCDGYS